MIKLVSPGPWIQHAGNKMPVCLSGDELVEIETEKGNISRPLFAYKWDWDGFEVPISKYRTEVGNTRVYPVEITQNNITFAPAEATTTEKADKLPSLAAYKEVARLNNSRPEWALKWHQNPLENSLRTDHARMIEKYEPERLISKRDWIAKEILITVFGCSSTQGMNPITKARVVEKLAELGIGDD